jgi:hypothetical protein
VGGQDGGQKGRSRTADTRGGKPSRAKEGREGDSEGAGWLSGVTGCYGQEGGEVKLTSGDTVTVGVDKRGRDGGVNSGRESTGEHGAGGGSGGAGVRGIVGPPGSFGGGDREGGVGEVVVRAANQWRQVLVGR